MCYPISVERRAEPLFFRASGVFAGCSPGRFAAPATGSTGARAQAEPRAGHADHRSAGSDGWGIRFFFSVRKSSLSMITVLVIMSCRL